MIGKEDNDEELIVSLKELEVNEKRSQIVTGGTHAHENRNNSKKSGRNKRGSYG